MTESLKPLLELQEIDTARDRLTERLLKLPEKQELADLEARMAEVRAAVAGVGGEIEVIIKEMERQEGELVLIEQKITREEAKLYGGEVSNPKELSALQAEIEMLKRRKAPLEEGVLEQMVMRDERYDERDRLNAELADLGKEAEAVRSRIAEASGEVERRLGEELSRREAIVPDIPEEVLELYENLRQSRKGVGVGALQNGVCTACREALSAVEVDRIRQVAKAGETLFRCEHCRRILVVN